MAKKDEVAFKYTVENLAEDLGVQQQTVRIGLRKHGIEKTGNVYGWNNEKDYKAVLAKLKGDGKESKAAKKATKKEAA
jgi:hypothetical protein